MNYLKWIKKHLWMLRSLPQTIYFNFRMLPFEQARKLPIWLYKPKFEKLSGKIIIDCPKNELKCSMIKLGKKRVNLFPNNGCMLDIKGTIAFKGSCVIGNDSYISVADSGCLQFGKGFSASTSLKIACYYSITFKQNVHVGWNCLFMDTDFHKLTREDGSQTRGYAPIVVEDAVWFGSECKIYKRTHVPAQCIVSSMTFLSGPVDCPNRSLIGNSRSVEVKVTGIYRDYQDDKINYETIN